MDIAVGIGTRIDHLNQPRLRARTEWAAGVDSCSVGATCEQCGQDMATGASCVETPVEFENGVSHPPVRYGAEEDDWGAESGEP